MVPSPQRPSLIDHGRPRMTYSSGFPLYHTYPLGTPRRRPRLESHAEHAIATVATAVPQEPIGIAAVRSYAAAPDALDRCARCRPAQSSEPQRLAVLARRSWLHSSSSSSACDRTWRTHNTLSQRGAQVGVRGTDATSSVASTPSMKNGAKARGAARTATLHQPVDGQRCAFAPPHQKFCKVFSAARRGFDKPIAKVHGPRARLCTFCTRSVCRGRTGARTLQNPCY